MIFILLWSGSCCSIDKVRFETVGKRNTEQTESVSKWNKKIVRSNVLFVFLGGFCFKRKIPYSCVCCRYPNAFERFVYLENWWSQGK